MREIASKMARDNIFAISSHIIQLQKNKYCAPSKRKKKKLRKIAKNCCVALTTLAHGASHHQNVSSPSCFAGCLLSLLSSKTRSDGDALLLHTLKHFATLHIPYAKCGKFHWHWHWHWAGVWHCQPSVCASQTHHHTYTHLCAIFLSIFCRFAAQDLCLSCNLSVWGTFYALNAC